MNSQRWALGGILLLGAALRLPSLLHAGLWRDEAYLYVELSAPTFSQFFHRFSLTEYFPPLYFLLMYFWSMVAGFSEAALKFPSFACSVLTIAAVFRLGRIAHDARTGLLASFLFAIMPLAIAPASDARPYSLLALLLTLLAAAYLQLRMDATPKRFAGTVLLTLLAVYTHYLALLAVFAFVVLGLAGAVESKRWARSSAAIVIGALPFILWLPVFLGQLAVGIPWKPPASAAAKAGFFGVSLIQSIPTGSWWAVVLFALGLIFVLVFGAARTSPAMLAGVFLVVLLSEAAAGLPDMRYVYPFYGLFAVFEAWIVVETAAILKIRGSFLARSFAVACAAGIVIVALATGGATAVASAVPHSGVRTLVAANPPEPEDLYIIAPDYMSATFYYYTRDRIATFIGFVRIRDSQFFRAAGYEKDWNDPSALPRAKCVVRALAGRFRYLIFLANTTARNQWHVPYAKTWELLAFLKTRYRLESTASFPGSEERVSVYTFRPLSTSASKPSHVGSFTIHQTMPPLAPLLAICAARAASAAPASSKPNV